jgi:hypothetical protein
MSGFFDATLIDYLSGIGIEHNEKKLYNVCKGVFDPNSVEAVNQRFGLVAHPTSQLHNNWGKSLGSQ